MLQAGNTLPIDVFPEATDLPPPPVGHQWFRMHAFGPAWVLLQMDPRWNQPIPPTDVPVVTHFTVGQRDLGELGMVNVLIPITGETKLQ